MAGQHHAAGDPVPAGAATPSRRSQEYEVPLRKDWAVLDGLNHIKDQLDGTLSYRWSCRMGICGSCGMTVNGEPKLTCATFLTDYAPGPDPRRAAARTSRSSATSSSTSSDFMHKLPRVKPWIIREDDEKPSSRRRVPPDAGASWTTTSSSACASTACSATPPARSTGSTRTSSARRRSRWPQRYNLDSRDQGAGERLDVLIEHEGVWGCTFVGECTRVCPKHVDPGRRHPALQAEGGAADGEGVPAAAGRAMTARRRRPMTDLRCLPAPRLDLVVDCGSGPTSCS